MCLLDDLIASVSPVHHKQQLHILCSVRCDMVNHAAVVKNTLLVSEEFKSSWKAASKNYHNIAAVLATVNLISD